MNQVAEDKTTMRRLSVAIFAMCLGTLGIVVLAVTVGHHFG